MKAEASQDELYSSVVSVYSVASCSAASAGSWAGSSVSSAGTEATDSVSSAGSKATDAAYSAGSKATDAAYSAASKATDAAHHAGTKATDAAGQAYASITSALAKATDNAKDVTFDTWSDSELKAYLDRYGINTYQGSTRNELIAAVRRNAHAFRYGSGDHGIYGQTKAMCWQMYNRIACGMGWVRDRFYVLLGFSAKKAEAAGDRVYERVYEAGQKASDRAYESGQKVYDSAKEKATEAKDRVKEEL